MEKKSNVQSLDRAFGILEALSLQPKGMRLQELAQATGLNKSTAHRLLASLADLGYVQKRGEADGRYRLSFKFLEIAGRVAGGVDVLEVARPAMEKLRDTIQEAVHLVVRDGCDIVYIHKLEGNAGAYQMTSRIGMRRPLYCTAAGKSILAELNDREIAEVWEQSDIRAYTSHTLLTLERLYRELDSVRRQGYALDNEENELGVRCVGAAIHDYSTRHCAALSVSAPLSRMPRERTDELAALLMDTARNISCQLGAH